jgi:hypothetical protein
MWVKKGKGGSILRTLRLNTEATVFLSITLTKKFSAKEKDGAGNSTTLAAQIRVPLLMLRK